MSGRRMRMEMALMEDGEGKYLEALVTEFTECEQAVREALYRGLPPEEYRRMQEFQQALQVAVEVVREIWRRHHGEAG